MTARTTSRAMGLLLLAGSIVLSAVGQLAMKAGMVALHGPGVHGAVAASASPALGTSVAWTLGGLAAYGCSMLIWLGVLVRYPLSYAYPLLGLSYALVYAGATHWPALTEPATPARTLGTLLIVAGVALVSTTGRSRDR